MTDRAGVFAAGADSLTAMCAYWFAAAVLIAGREAWGVSLAWPLLCAAAGAVLWPLVLKKPRSTAALGGLTLGLAAASLGLFALVSRTPLSFGYGFLLAVGAGMAAGVPLYHTLRRPTVSGHLKHLDLLILVLAALLLVREALDISGGTAALMTAVLLMDAAGAVGLRMSDGRAAGRDGADALRGTLLALAAAAALALVVALLTALLSRGGETMGRVLGGLGAFFAAVGSTVERFFRALASFARPMETDGTAVAGPQAPSLAEADAQPLELGGSSGGEALGIALCALVLAAAVAAVVLLRKRRFSARTGVVAAAPGALVRRRAGAGLWRRLLDELRFRYAAFARRDTPAGLLVRLERLGRRRGSPRRAGESMRQFIRRMDGSGGLDALADALDRAYYGGGGGGLSPRTCRALRRTMRRTVRHG